MNDTSSPIFVRQDLVPERPAPVKTTGFTGFLRTRLFNSPTNILITIVSALLLWFILVPALKFVLFDAIGAGLWSGVAIGLGFLFSDAINQVLAVFEALGRIGLERSVVNV